MDVNIDGMAAAEKDLFRYLTGEITYEEWANLSKSKEQVRRSLYKDIFPFSLLTGKWCHVCYGRNSSNLGDNVGRSPSNLYLYI